MESILQLCGSISVIGAAGAIIYKVTRPAAKFKRRVDEIERVGEENNKALKGLVESNRDQNLLLLAIIDHMIDGNGIEHMKKIRKEFQEKVL